MLNVNFRKNKNNNSLIAFAEVIILDTYKVTGFKLWDNKGLLKVQMPGYTNVGKNGHKYHNSYFSFINPEHQKAFESAILGAWLEKCEQERQRNGKLASSERKGAPEKALV